MIAEALNADVGSPTMVVTGHEGGVELIDEFADEWRQLCELSGDDQPFYRPEWIGAWLLAFAPHSRVLLLTARSGKDLHLILPLISTRTTFSGVPVRKLWAPVNSHSCRFDLVRSPGVAGDVALQACWQYLKTLNNWDLLEFRGVPEGSALDHLMPGASRAGFHTVAVPERPNPMVRVPSDPKLLAQMPSNARLRTKLRQVRRQLAENGSLRLQRFDVANREALANFYHLEASGWKGKEGSAIICDAQTRQFYDEVAESASRFGYFSLYLLEWRGDLLAGHFAVTHHGRWYSPKVAYNEKYKEFMPGHLIVSEILQDCAMRGIHTYDITGPDDEWKMKWTSETRAVNHHFFFAPTPAAQAAFALRFKLRPAIGRILRRGRSGVQERASIT